MAGVVVDRESCHGKGPAHTRAELRPDDYWRHWPDLKKPKSRPAAAAQEAAHG